MATEAQAQPLAGRVHWVAGLGRTADASSISACAPLCPTCREPVADPGAVCSQCWSKLTFISRPYCERLGIPFAYDPGPGVLSIEAIADPPSYIRARAAVRYDETARTMVQALDVATGSTSHPPCGRGMGVRRARASGRARRSLVPVPLHWRRLWSRRFNQAATLAQTVSRISGVAVAHDFLKRVRATRQQVGLTQAERARNVQGAFRVPREVRPQVLGKRLLLVDDVLTSGATLDTCARILLRAGASNVDVLVFARVVQAHRAPI